MASEKRANDHNIGGEYTDASSKRQRGETPGHVDKQRFPTDTTTSKPPNPSGNPSSADLDGDSNGSRSVSPEKPPVSQKEPEKDGVLNAEQPSPNSDAIGAVANPSAQSTLPSQAATDAGAETVLETDSGSASQGLVDAESPESPSEESQPHLPSDAISARQPETSDSSVGADNSVEPVSSSSGESKEPVKAELPRPDGVGSSKAAAADAESEVSVNTTMDTPADPQTKLQSDPLAKAGNELKESSEALEASVKTPAALQAPASVKAPSPVQPLTQVQPLIQVDTSTKASVDLPSESQADTKVEPPIKPDNHESQDSSRRPATEASTNTRPVRSESPIDVDMVIGALNNPDCGAEVMKAHANAITAHQQVQAYAKLAGSGWTYYVQKLQVVIGRNAADSTETVDIDLAPSKIVSRKHAVIHYNLSARVWEVFTVGRNGIRIDNSVVRRGNTAPLKSGTVIDAGNMQMMFVLPDAEPEVAPLYVQRLRARQSETVVSEQTSSSGQGDEKDATKPVSGPPAPSYPRGVTILTQPPVSAAENFMNELSRDECRDIKPPFSYATMIAQSILSTPEHKMTLADIYAWISSHYAFYRFSKPGWQNSIRHNLSLNKAFEKAARKENEPGKGSKWFIVEQYKDELIRKATTGQEQRGVYTPRQPFDALPHPTNRGTHSTTPRATTLLPDSASKPPKVPVPVNPPLKRVTGVSGKQPGMPMSPPQQMLPPLPHSQPSAPLPQLSQQSQPQSQAYSQNIPLTHPNSGRHPVAMPVTGALNYGPPETPVGNPNMMPPNLAATNMVNGNVPSPPLPSQPGPYGYPYMTPYGIQYFHPQTGQLLSPQHGPILTNPPMPHLPPQMAPQMAYNLPESVKNEYNQAQIPLQQSSPDSRNTHSEHNGALNVSRNEQYHPMMYSVAPSSSGLPPQYSAAPAAHPGAGLQAGVELASERNGSLPRSHPQSHEQNINADGEQRQAHYHPSAGSQMGMASPNPSELHTPARRTPTAHAGFRGTHEYADPAIGNGLLDSAIKLPPNSASGMPESSPALWKYMNLESTPNRASPTRNNADDRAHNNAPDSSPAAQHASNHNLAGSLPLMDKWEGSKA